MRIVAVALVAVVVPAVARADTTAPVDLQITTTQPQKVGLGETFAVGVTVGTNPDGAVDSQQFPISWSLTWAVTFPGASRWSVVGGKVSLLRSFRTASQNASG